MRLASTPAAAHSMRWVSSRWLISSENMSTGVRLATAAWATMPSANEVLWVGIIDSPARYRWLGESTAMHLTGAEVTARILVIARLAIRPVNRRAGAASRRAALRGRRN